MADAITLEDLENAKIDVDALAAVVNGPAAMVRTRYGGDVRSLSMIEGNVTDRFSTLEGTIMIGVSFADQATGEANTVAGQRFAVRHAGALDFYARTVGGSTFEYTVSYAAWSVRTTSGVDYYQTDGKVWIGSGNNLGSFDSSLVISRDHAALTDNAHDLSVSSRLMDMGGYAYAASDMRGTVEAGNGNHLAPFQAAWTWNSPGTLTDWYDFISSGTINHGIVTRYSGFRFNAPAVNNDAVLKQIIALNIASFAEYQDPLHPTTDTTYYAFQHAGSGRIDHNGQARFRNARIGYNDGGRNEALDIEIDGATNGFLWISQSGVWNWRYGMVKDDPALYIKGNNTTAFKITAVTNHLIPGAAGTQNLAESAHPMNNGWFVNAIIVTSDETLKTGIRPVLEDEKLLRWGLAIQPMVFKMRQAVREKGRAAILKDRGEEDTGQVLDEAEVERRGLELARNHVGVIAQQVFAAGIKAGIENPFDWGVIGRDPKIERVTKKRKVTRQKVQKVPMQRPYIEIVDGVPVQKFRTVEEDHPLVEHKSVIGEDGKPVMVDGKAIIELVPHPRLRGKMIARQAHDKDGNPLHEKVPLTADVPVMETVTESYVEDVVVTDRSIKGPDKTVYQLNIRYDELKMLVYAATANYVAQLDRRVTALEPAK